jgi:hypothetical protein
LIGFCHYQPYVTSGKNVTGDLGLVKAATTEDNTEDRCKTCRGRGWLIVRSRPVYRPDALKVSTAELAREECWDCGGEGRAAA